MTGPFGRISLMVLVAAIAGAGIWLGQEAPHSTETQGSIVAAPYRLCPVAEAGGGFSSRVGVYLEGGGSSRISALGGPNPAESFQFSEKFAYRTQVGDLAELGLTPVLIESPAVAGVYNKAGDAAAVSECVSATPDPVAVLGMSTKGDERSSLILSNPFAVAAEVQLEGVSEFGLDTPTNLERVRIPPATSLVLDFTQTMAGRESLSFVITKVSGSAVAGMRREGGGDVAALEAIAGSTEWYFAIPDFGIDGAIHVRPLSDGETAYRIDRIEPDGLVEGVTQGTVAAQSEAVFSLSDLEAGEGGFLFASDQPVAAAIVYASDGVRAVSSGASRATNSWVVPVSARPSEGRTAIWLLNTTDQDLTATIEALEGPAGQTVDLPAGTTTGIILLGLRGSGALVTGDGPIAVFYGVLSGQAVGMAAATPFE